jgi:hypothetical protein
MSRAGQAKAQGIDRLQPSIADQIRRLQKTQALLIAVQFAANHEAEFDVSDALAVVVTLINDSLAGLDRLEASS